MGNEVGQALIDIETELAHKLQTSVTYPSKVRYIYNPLDYAIAPHTDFVLKYANSAPKPVLFLGMNPGPWGMAQTGLKFECNATNVEQFT